MNTRKPNAKHYTATIVYRTGNPLECELVTHTISQDVTDSVKQGDSFEEICDRIYWKQIHPNPYFDVLSSGVISSGRPGIAA